MRFTVADTEIYISYYFILMLTVFVLIDNTKTAPLLILAIAVHETGHLLMLKLFNAKINSVKFYIYGISIERETQLNISYYKEILIYSAGVIFNIITASVCSIINYSATSNFIAVNIALAVFNILPIGRLDGGQLIYNTACLKYEKYNVDKIFKAVSFIFLIPIFAFSTFAVLYDIKYISLLICMVYLSIFVFTL